MGSCFRRIAALGGVLIFSCGLSLSAYETDECARSLAATAKAFANLKLITELAKQASTNNEVSEIISSLEQAVSGDRLNPEVWAKAGDVFCYLSIRHPKRAKRLLAEAIRHYRNAYDLAEDEIKAAPFKRKMIAAEEREGNGMFLREFYAMVTSDVKVLTGPSKDIEVSVPDFSKVDSNMEFAPIGGVARLQYMISNRLSQIRVVLQMLGEQDDESLREVLHLGRDAESPSSLILGTLPSVQAVLVGNIGRLTELGDVENALKDIAELWTLSVMAPETWGSVDLSLPNFMRPDLKHPFRDYSSSLLRAFEKISTAFYRDQTWKLIRVYADDSSRLSWADLLTLTQLAKFLMSGQHSPFEQVDLAEMRAHWASEGLRKLKAQNQQSISPAVLRRLEELFSY